MKVQLAKGSTSVILTVFIQDSSSTTGAGLGSLDQTSSVVGGYVRMGGTGVALAVDENVTTEGTYQAPTTAGQVRIGTPANMRTGIYELHFHNDLFASGADVLTVSLGGATNMADLILEVQLTNVNLNDGVRAGLTALPNAAADAAGGVPISDAGGLDLDNRMLASAAVTNLNTLYDGVEGFAPAYVGPRGLGVYLNDAAANTNTVNGVDGTWNNPVSTIAAAKTIADSLSLDRIYLINDTAITLAATMEDYEFVGIGEMAANTINLGSQDVDNSHFENVLITGAQGGAGRLQARDCVLSAITGMEITAVDCLFASGTLTLRDDCAFCGCWSAVAGGGTPILDINSVASVNVYCRHYSGGLQINNAVATTVMSYETDGQLVIDATCTSLTVHVRGNCTITDNGTTTSLTQSAAINQANINAEVDAAIGNAALATAANLATVDTVVDAIKAVTDLLPNAGALSDLAAILTDTAVIGAAGAGLTDLGGMAAGMKAEVNAEVVDVLKTDTVAQLAQQAPPGAPTLETAIMYLYQYFRNKREQTSTEIKMYDDAGSTVIAKNAISDDATTFTDGEYVTGP